MIERLLLEGFRGVKTGEIHLAPLTILVGPNNSGKTSILEALFLLPNPLRKVPYGDHTAASLLEHMHRTLDSAGYAFLFHNYDYTAGTTRLGCDAYGEHYTLELASWGKYIYLITNANLRSKTTWYDGKTVNCFGALSPAESGLSIHDDMTYILGDSLLLNPRLTEEAISYLRSNWVSIINRGITKKVAQEASQLTYDAYEDLTIEPYLAGRYAVYAYMKDGRRVRLGDLGDGLQSYMVSRILYEVSRPQLLLWDDVEAHFNPRILHAVALWIGDLLREGRQAVVSTHSLEAVRIIAGVNEEHAKIQLTHLKDGQLKLRTLTVKEVEELAKAGVDVRVGEQLLL